MFLRSSHKSNKPAAERLRTSAPVWGRAKGVWNANSDREALTRCAYKLNMTLGVLGAVQPATLMNVITAHAEADARESQKILKSLDALQTEVAGGFEHMDSRFDRIEGLLKQGGASSASRWQAPPGGFGGAPAVPSGGDDLSSSGSSASSGYSAACVAAQAMSVAEIKAKYRVRMDVEHWRDGQWVEDFVHYVSDDGDIMVGDPRACASYCTFTVRAEEVQYYLRPKRR